MDMLTASKNSEVTVGCSVLAAAQVINKTDFWLACKAAISRQRRWHTPKYLAVLSLLFSN
jgi:hypothetical protein